MMIRSFSGFSVPLRDHLLTSFLFGFLTLIVLGKTQAQTSETFKGHPRLFLSSQEMMELRQRTQQNPWKSIVDRMIARTTREIEPFDTPVYDFRLLNFAGLFLATGDPEAARQAALAAERLMADQEFWLNPRSKGLSRASGARMLAIAYDLCYEAWPDELNRRVSQELLRAAQALLKSMGEGANHYPGNNWQAVRYGAAGLALLASDEAEAGKILPSIIPLLQRHFRENLGGGVWNPEGIGYNVYPAQFSIPFIIAARRLGLKDPLASMPNVSRSFTTTLLPTVPIYGLDSLGFYPDLSDDNPNYYGEGTAALLFGLLPESEHPRLKWLFDSLHHPRHGGLWDDLRGGSLFTLLFYPHSITAENPSPQGPFTFHDPVQGTVFFRNHYCDNQDIVLTANATQRRAVGGHAGPDVNTLRLTGLGAPWIVGAGRTWNTAGQSNLFAGPPPDRGTRETGRLLAVVPPTLTTPGHVVIEGSSMGVINHRRSLWIDFTNQSGYPAVMSSIETSENGRLWRLQTPGMHSIELGPSSAQVKSPQGASMRLEIIYPESVTLRQGWVRRVSAKPHLALGFQGQNFPDNQFIEFDCGSEVVVFITLQKNEQPPPRITRTPHGALVHLPGQTWIYDRNKKTFQPSPEDEVTEFLASKGPIRPFQWSLQPIEKGRLLAQWSTLVNGPTPLRVEIQRQEDAETWLSLGTFPFSAGRAVLQPPPSETPLTHRIRFSDGTTFSPFSDPIQAQPWPKTMQIWQTNFVEGHPELQGFKQVTRGRSRPLLTKRKTASGATFWDSGPTPIKTVGAMIHERVAFDFSSPLSAVEVELAVQSKVGMHLLFKDRSGQWLAGNASIIESARQRRIHSIYPHRSRKWFKVDPQTLELGEETSAPDFSHIQGLGLRFNWVLNQTWIHLYGLNIRAMPSNEH